MIQIIMHITCGYANKLYTEGDKSLFTLLNSVDMNSRKVTKEGSIGYYYIK